LLQIPYRQGIFPWPHEGYPLLWFSPDPRFILPPRQAHIHHSLRKQLRRGAYDITFDRSFSEVMLGCQQSARPGQRGTWITAEMMDGYTELHRQGFAHSVEAWQGGDLVGGLYGVSFGRVFFGESMFARAPDASKVAFATLIANLLCWEFQLIDCQSYTEHLARFGALEIPRTQFTERLERALSFDDKLGPWPVDISSVDAFDVIRQAQHPEDG
jgi:leucyl/phenylalanyl-tRNA--protein transferase